LRQSFNTERGIPAAKVRGVSDEAAAALVLGAGSDQPALCATTRASLTPTAFFTITAVFPHQGGLFTRGISCSFPSSSICKLTGINTITQVFNPDVEQRWPQYQVLSQQEFVQIRTFHWTVAFSHF